MTPLPTEWWIGALAVWGATGWIAALAVTVFAARRQRLLEDSLRIWYWRATAPHRDAHRDPIPTPVFTPEQSEALRAASRLPPEPPPLPAPVETPAPFPPGVIERRHTGILPRYVLPGERPGEFPAVRTRPDGRYAYIFPRK